MSLKPTYKPHTKNSNLHIFVDLFVIIMMVCYRTTSERFIIIIFWSIFFKKVKISH